MAPTVPPNFAVFGPDIHFLGGWIKILGTNETTLCVENTMTTDLVPAGITEKRPLLRSAEKGTFLFAQLFPVVA